MLAASYPEMEMPIRTVLRRRTLRALAVIVWPLLLTASISAQRQPYKIVDRWKLGGEGGWDYLLADSSAHRLYIAHGTRVETVDTQSGKPVGAITGLHGAHGIALDTGGKFGYISDGGGNAVVVFDRFSLAKVATIPAGENPDAIVFEPATQTVWAFNGRSRDITVISATTRKVVATIGLPGKPEFAAVDGNGTVFDNIEDKNLVVRLDAHTRTLTASWPIPCDSPSGLALDVAGHRLFSVCDGKKMAVTDSLTGKLLATAAIGDSPDDAAYAPSRNLAFASCGEGVLSIVNAGAPGYPTIAALPTQRGARTMTYDPITDRIYVVAAAFGPSPPATAQNPHPRAGILPGTFTVLVIGHS